MDLLSMNGPCACKLKMQAVFSNNTGTTGFLSRIFRRSRVLDSTPYGYPSDVRPPSLNFSNKSIDPLIRLGVQEI